MFRGLICFLLLTTQAFSDEATVLEIASKPLGKGTLQVFRPAGPVSDQVLVHFHGAGQFVCQALARSQLDVVLVVVNFPGLSSAYSQPFASDPQLFQQILAQARQLATELPQSPGEPWEKVYLSSFSAGYGAVREILKSPSNFNQVVGIVAADSIYAGLEADASQRTVDKTNMRDFLRFATLASESKKRMILSHSAQATPYASTTETADYLLNSLNIARKPDHTLALESLPQSSSAARGNLLVLGFDGTSGAAHMQHLHHIDLFWKRLKTAKP